jgi:hypothetical protein
VKRIKQERLILGKLDKKKENEEKWKMKKQFNNIQQIVKKNTTK